MADSPVIYLTRRATFSASHRLHSTALSDEENARFFGKCNRINGHGHNYVVEVTLRGEIDPRTGVLMDLAELRDLIEEHIIAKVDHRHLNHDVSPFDTLNPTAENIAVTFWKWLKPHLPEGILYEMALQETENNRAIYRGEPLSP
jgi:6-pyruvoyltetrahydropterin/6-carboxytetrahydropterin synthase